MSFDLFVGLPSSRILRSRELLEYFNSGQEQEGTILPEIAAFALELAKEWPPLNPAGVLTETARDPGDSRVAEYSFSPDSLYLSFAWSRQAEALEKVCALAVQRNLLFLNFSALDWVNATRKPGTGRAGEIFLVEKDGRQAGGREWSGRTTWIEPGDADLLTDPMRDGRPGSG